MISMIYDDFGDILIPRSIGILPRNGVNAVPSGRDFHSHLDAMADDTPSPTSGQSVVTVRKITWSQYLTQHPVALWTNQEICEWLIVIELGHLVPVFSKFTGATLLALSDRLVDEVFNSNNPSVKELGSSYQVADKVNFKLHFERLRNSSPFLFKLYDYLGSTIHAFFPKVQSELVSKMSSKTVDALLKGAAFGIATVATGYVALEWTRPKKSKKE